MDYNQIAADIISELKIHARQSDKKIAERLGISRQAYFRRRKTNSLTTEDITVLSAWLVTGFGGGFYLGALENFQQGNSDMSRSDRTIFFKELMNLTTGGLNPTYLAIIDRLIVGATDDQLTAYLLLAKARAVELRQNDYDD